MQVFLSESTVRKSAEMLDNRRLNKQCIETIQIIFINYCKEKNMIYKVSDDYKQIISDDDCIISFSGNKYTNKTVYAKKTKQGNPVKIGHFNHPIILLYSNYIRFLFYYLNAIIEEMKNRKMNNKIIYKIQFLQDYYNKNKELYMPCFYNCENYINYMKKILYIKDKEYYKSYKNYENYEFDIKTCNCKKNNKILKE